MPNSLFQVVMLLVANCLAAATLSARTPCEQTTCEKAVRDNMDSDNTHSDSVTCNSPANDEAAEEDAAQRRRASQIVEATRSVAKGQVTVVRTSTTTNRDVLIHFHGAIETTRTALARSDFHGTLIIVNFSGLSSAYSKPFEADTNLLDTLLQLPFAGPTKEPDASGPQASRVTLSSFSAGYGAIREILKQPRNFDRISAIVTADSIYAGLEEGVDETVSTRSISKSNMQDFLRFARLAMQGEKTFVLSHSAQPTPYASTTETADYLLRSLGMDRISDAQSKSGSMQSVSQASRGRFTVLGFAGEAAEAHMQHLRNIDLFWNRCFAK